MEKKIKVTRQTFGDLIVKSAEQALQITKEINKGYRLMDGKCVKCAAKNDKEFWCYYGCPPCVCEKDV